MCRVDCCRLHRNAGVDKGSHCFLYGWRWGACEHVQACSQACVSFPDLSSPWLFETRPLYSLELSQYGRLALSLRELCPHLPAHPHTLLFMWVLELRLRSSCSHRKALYWPNHFPSSTISKVSLKLFLFLFPEGWILIKFSNTCLVAKIPFTANDVWVLLFCSNMRCSILYGKCSQFVLKYLIASQGKHHTNAPAI